MAPPAEPAPPAAPAPPGSIGWLELVGTVLLVVAAVGTSWSSYQATRWHGEQATATSRTNAARIDAAREAALGESQSGVDVATFIAWADADRRGEAELADFYVDRFRDEFKPAFDAWIATAPLTNPEAPSTPFVMPEYRVAAQQKAAVLDRQAVASAAEVAEDIQRASNYVLSVVLYAVVLFFAGISTKIADPRVKRLLTLTGLAVFVGTVAWVATFPVSVAI